MNKKSQGILKHIGLKLTGEDKNTFYCYQGTYEDLLIWYNQVN
jgi:hypothetical protein